MSRIVVALVIWLYFMRIINYYALKVEFKPKPKSGDELKQEYGGMVTD